MRRGRVSEGERGRDTVLHRGGQRMREILRDGRKVVSTKRVRACEGVRRRERKRKRERKRER